MARQRHDSMKVLSLFNGRPPSAAPVAVLCAAVLCLTAMLLPAAVQAQNTGVQELLNRVDRLQRELSTLQRQVYKGEAPPAAAALPLSPGAGNTRDAARHSIRIAQLERELQQLTGRIEEIGFRTQQIQARLEKLVSDMDQRLTALEGGTQSGPRSGPRSGTVPQSVGSPPSNVGLTLRPPPAVQSPSRPQSQPPSVQAPSPPTGAALARGAAPRVLGTIPKNMAVSSPRGPANVPPQPPQPPIRAQSAPSAAPAAQTAAVLPAGTPKAQYDYALSLMLKQQNFAKAETALKSFIETNPNDGLTGNAHYWLGETFYVRKSYQDAAFAFAEGFQKYPKGNKAPDSLLKLGMSLDRLEKRREACTAYSRLLSTFPKAGARIKARVQREQSRAKCR
jgi:tol-pal system protein YbgF